MDFIINNIGFSLLAEVGPFRPLSFSLVSPMDKALTTTEKGKRAKKPETVASYQTLASSSTIQHDRRASKGTMEATSEKALLFANTVLMCGTLLDGGRGICVHS